MGKLPKEIILFLEKKNICIHTQEIFLTFKGLSHLFIDSKRNRKAGLSDEDILEIPKILTNPNAIFFDNFDKIKNNLLYCSYSISYNKIVKIIVDMIKNLKKSHLLKQQDILKKLI